MFGRAARHASPTENASHENVTDPRVAAKGTHSGPDRGLPDQPDERPEAKEDKTRRSSRVVRANESSTRRAATASSTRLTAAIARENRYWPASSANRTAACSPRAHGELSSNQPRRIRAPTDRCGSDARKRYVSKRFAEQMQRTRHDTPKRRAWPAPCKPTGQTPHECVITRRLDPLPRQRFQDLRGVHVSAFA